MRHQELRDCAFSAGLDQRMGSGKGCHQIFPADPQRILQFLGVDGDRLGNGLAPAADHQAGGKGPGLAGQIIDLTNHDARFFVNLAAHGGLDGLAGFDKACQQGIHPLGPGRAAPQQQAVATGDQHDDDRVGAREMQGATGRALALPTGMAYHRGRAATGAEAVAAVPFQQGARRCGQFGVARGQVCHHGAQFAKQLGRGQVGVGLNRGVEETRLLGRRIIRHPGRKVLHEQRAILVAPQKQRAVRPPGQRMGRRQKRQPGALVHQRPAAPHRQHAGPRPQRGQSVGCCAQFRRPVQPGPAKCHAFSRSHAAPLSQSRPLMPCGPAIGKPGGAASREQPEVA